MRINMLSNFSSKRLLSFQAVLSEPENQKRVPYITSNQNVVKPGAVNGKN
jgi:hypothetical protein